MLNHHEVCIALDKLTVEMVALMEQKMKSQINIENLMKDANLQMAKARYIMGHQSVGSLQLPTENSNDFSALSTVNRESIDVNEASTDRFNLVTVKPDSDTDLINPIRWFGVLVPQNLHQAQNIYKRALEYAVESLNVQKQLQSTCDEIVKLRRLKDSLAPEE